MNFSFENEELLFNGSLFDICFGGNTVLLCKEFLDLLSNDIHKKEYIVTDFSNLIHI